MDGEDYNRTGSADSENGSDNSYVQVSTADVPADSEPQALGVEDSGIPSTFDSDDIYSGNQDETVEEQPPQPTLDTPPPEAFNDGEYIDSPEEPEESQPLLPPKRVEEVAPSVQIPTQAPSATIVTQPSKRSEAPVASGYLQFLNMLHPIVLYLIYWRDIRLSAVVLGVELLLLLTLTLNTLIHTIVLFLLSFLVVSLVYIVIKVVIDSFYNREVKNPFSDYLNKKISLPEDKIIEWTHYLINVLNQRFNRLVRLLLFDNIKQSLKFGLTLWLVSFVTNYLSLLTLLFLAVLLSFSVPPLYERFQPLIDSNINMAVGFIKQAICTIKSRIPYLGKNKAD